MPLQIGSRGKRLSALNGGVRLLIFWSLILVDIGLRSFIVSLCNRGAPFSLSVSFVPKEGYPTSKLGVEFEGGITAVSRNRSLLLSPESKNNNGTLLQVLTRNYFCEKIPKVHPLPAISHLLKRLPSYPDVFLVKHCFDFYFSFTKFVHRNIACVGSSVSETGIVWSRVLWSFRLNGMMRF
ncbi:hypothetical protein ACS0TY_003262 [Phlomoides rotata]